MLNIHIVKNQNVIFIQLESDRVFPCDFPYVVQDVSLYFCSVAVVSGEGKLGVGQITVLEAWVRSEVACVVGLHVVEPKEFT